MPKTKVASPKRPTHFEQIPLDVVKKIAEEDVPKSNQSVPRRKPNKRER